ncbi:FGFR1 oncogene partner-like, partial [Anarrhichthys ocellatus]|uniref:FGFR1 oncogene partner-like n=1 Tax=Anarrhichthys ocellatus TaxID=433405 RepID=UPI0012EE8463
HGPGPVRTFHRECEEHIWNVRTFIRSGLFLQKPCLWKVRTRLSSSLSLIVFVLSVCLSGLSLSVLPAEDRLSELRKVESSRTRGSPAGSLSEAPRSGPGPGGGSSNSEQSHSRNGASRGFRDSKAPNDKTGSLHLEDDVEYDDDFNSHRSDLSKSELSIGEEIEEVSIEGPDVSDKFDESTQDLSVSQLSQSHGADYMEEVA